MSEYHVTPNSDLIDHVEHGEDCICGPDIELWPSVVDKTVHVIFIHHSLDGREMTE